MILTAILDTFTETSPSSIASLAGLIQYFVGVGASAGSAPLGARVLVSSLGAERVKQGVKESAIAGAVGSAVWIAACLALTLIVMLIISTSGGLRLAVDKIKSKRRNGRAGDVVAMERVESGAAGPLIKGEPAQRV